jgi:hypothetical protein
MNSLYCRFGLVLLRRFLDGLPALIRHSSRERTSKHSNTDNSKNVPPPAPKTDNR